MHPNNRKKWNCSSVLSYTCTFHERTNYGSGLEKCQEFVIGENGNLEENTKSDICQFENENVEIGDYQASVAPLLISVEALGLSAALAATMVNR